MGTYSFNTVQAAIAGPGGSVIIGNGAGPSEEGLTITMVEDKDTMVAGADGQVMHSLHAGKMGRAVLRLLKTSPVNAVLSAMYNFQTVSPGAHGQNTITVSDTARGDFISCQQAAFAKQPDLTYSKDAGVNEWVFNVGVVDEILGIGQPEAN